ncbi:hypothetical protein ABG067_007966, partial [Albugo candida]
MTDDDAKDTVAVLDPRGDGNCGPRAVALAVFGLESSWVKVKRMMKTTVTNKKEVYETYISILREFPSADYVIDKLDFEEEECDEEYWFDTMVYPQIIADTFRRPVVMLSSSKRQFQATGVETDTYGNAMYNKERVTFVPLFDLDINYQYDPIILLNVDRHFLTVVRDVKITNSVSEPYTRWPVTINVLHATTMDAHKDAFKKTNQ